MAIKGDCRQIFQFSQFGFLIGNLLLNGAQLLNFFVSWVDVNFVVHGIQNQIVAIFHLSGDATGTHDGWQFQGTRHDRGVGSTATDVSDKAQHLLQVQLCGFRRRQVCGNQDNFILNGAQVNNGQTQDVAQQALTDVTYVSRTFFQVFIIQFFQGSCLTFDNFMRSCISRHVLIFNQGYDFLLQLLIFEQHDVPFEDGFFFFTESFASLGLDSFQLS